MTQITDDLISFEVPDGAVGLDINQYRGGSELNYWVNEEGKQNLIVKDLPPGNWQFICTTKEATRGDAFGLVKSHYSRSASYNPVLGHYQTSGSSTTFMDYINGHCTFDSPLDSLCSLLASKGLDVSKNYALLKKG